MHMTGIRARLRTLPHAASGAAMLEFALGLPLVLAIGAYGAELANYSIVNQRINQAALQLADNVSRVGNGVAVNGTQVYQLREIDINDVLQGVRLANDSINLTTWGRITISSLENIQQSYDTAPVQRIHWQRCLGLRGGTADPGYDSSYGTVSKTAGSTATQPDAGLKVPNGMGDPGAQVKSPVNNGVIFIEINYEYHPVFGALFSSLDNANFLTKAKIHYTASFIVRDNRDFSQIFNPSAAVPSTCDIPRLKPPGMK